MLTCKVKTRNISSVFAVWRFCNVSTHCNVHTSLWLYESELQMHFGFSICLLKLGQKSYSSSTCGWEFLSVAVIVTL